MRLIDADALKKAFNAWKAMDDYYHDTDCEDIPFSEAFDLIDNFPTVEEKPQGGWIETNSYDENIICPFCKTEFNGDIKLICGGENPKFCPNCGADMKGGAE